ncbi:MAG: YoaK family protein [Alcanivoracaceae bacterium]|nr:YoaK family protein [Alcanivoracaceae bacterium]
MPYTRDEHGKRIVGRVGEPWVFAGAGVLAAIAGYINVVMLGFFSVPVSHMSGAVSRLSGDIALGDMADLILISGIVAGFLAGAMLSGILIGAATLRAGRRYGGVLMLQGVMLAVATWLALDGVSLAVPLAAMACGLQNAMASSYRGLVLRTTHVTGVVTDIGVLIGQRLRRKKIRSWKLWLLLTLLLSFFVGGVAGALTLKAVGMQALGIAALVCFAVGAVYAMVQHARL